MSSRHQVIIDLVSPEPLEKKPEGSRKAEDAQIDGQRLSLTPPTRNCLKNTKKQKSSSSVIPAIPIVAGLIGTGKKVDRVNKVISLLETPDVKQTTITDSGRRGTIRRGVNDGDVDRLCAVAEGSGSDVEDDIEDFSEERQEDEDEDPFPLDDEPCYPIDNIRGGDSNEEIALDTDDIPQVITSKVIFSPSALVSGKNFSFAEKSSGDREDEEIMLTNTQSQPEPQLSQRKPLAMETSFFAFDGNQSLEIDESSNEVVAADMSMIPPQSEVFSKKRSRSDREADEDSEDGDREERYINFDITREENSNILDLTVDYEYSPSPDRRRRRTSSGSIRGSSVKKSAKNTVPTPSNAVPMPISLSQQSFQQSFVSSQGNPIEQSFYVSPAPIPPQQPPQQEPDRAEDTEDAPYQDEDNNPSNMDYYDYPDFPSPVYYPTLSQAMRDQQEQEAQEDRQEGRKVEESGIKYYCILDSDEENNSNKDIIVDYESKALNNEDDDEEEMYETLTLSQKVRSSQQSESPSVPRSDSGSDVIILESLEPQPSETTTVAANIGNGSTVGGGGLMARLRQKKLEVAAAIAKCDNTSTMSHSLSPQPMMSLSQSTVQSIVSSSPSNGLKRSATIPSSGPSSGSGGNSGSDVPPVAPQPTTTAGKKPRKTGVRKTQGLPPSITETTTAPSSSQQSVASSASTAGPRPVQTSLFSFVTSSKPTGSTTVPSSSSLGIAAMSTTSIGDSGYNGIGFYDVGDDSNPGHSKSYSYQSLGQQAQNWSRNSAISVLSSTSVGTAASANSNDSNAPTRVGNGCPTNPAMIPLDLSVEYDVTLLVDKRERSNALILGSLISARISCELANLAVGDFLWVAVPRKMQTTSTGVDGQEGDAGTTENGKKKRKKKKDQTTDDGSVEGVTTAVLTNVAGVDKDSILYGIEHEVLVLDCIAERKSIPDLASSLVDGRYMDQKCRLKTTGIKSCLYLVEGEHLVVPMQQRAITPQHIKTAMGVTFVEHDMHVIRTRGMDHTTQMLQYIHKQVAARFQQSYNTSKTQSRSVEPLLFQKFSDFQSLYGKKNASTYKQLFGHQLRQVHGCSTSAANALMDRFGTTASFMKFLSTTEKGYVLKTIENMQKKGDTKGRLGPKLAKTLYEVYYTEY